MVSRPGSSPPVITWKPTKADQALGVAIRNLDASGLQPVCRAWPGGGPWLSEVGSLRQIAQRWCQGCPLLTPCNDAANVGRVSFGVWGGRDVGAEIEAKEKAKAERAAAAAEKARAKAARARKTRTKTKTTARRTAR